MENYRYNAFISYKHAPEDMRIAALLQRKLENFKDPKDPQKTKKLHIFRDETELSGSSDLTEEIKDALRNSEYLILICSLLTSGSRWCMEEINYFKSIHNNTTDNIIVLVIDGEVEYVLPEQLCTSMRTFRDVNGNIFEYQYPVEPMAANISSPDHIPSMKKFKKEFYRVAAPLLGRKYDELYNREQKKHVIMISVSSVFAMALIMSIVIISTTIFQKQQMLYMQKAIAVTSEAEIMYEKGDRIGAIARAISVNPYILEPDKLLPQTRRFLIEATNSYKNADNYGRISGSMLNGTVKTRDEIKEMDKSPGNTKFMAIDKSSELYVWDKDSLKEVYRTDPVTDAVFVDEDNIIIMGLDGISKVNLTSGNTAWKIPIEEYSTYTYRSVDISSDGRTAVFTDTDADIPLMFADADTGKEIWSVYDKLTDINDIYSPYPLFSSFMDNGNYLCYKTNEKISIISPKNKTMQDLKNTLPDGYFMGSATYDNHIFAIEANDKNVASDVFDAEGNLVSSVTSDWHEYPWSRESTELFRYIKKNLIPLRMNGEYFTGVNLLDGLWFIGNTSGKTFIDTKAKSICSYYFMNDVNENVGIVYLNGEGEVRLIYDTDIESFTLGKADKTSGGVIFDARQMALILDDKRTVNVYSDQYDNGYTRKIDFEGFTEVVVSPDGKYIAASGKDKVINIYSSDDAKLVCKINDCDKVFCGSFYGKHFRYTDYNTEKVYDTSTGKLIFELDKDKIFDYCKAFKVNDIQGSIVCVGSDKNGNLGIYIRYSSDKEERFWLEEDRLPFSVYDIKEVALSADEQSVLIKTNSDANKEGFYEFNTVKKEFGQLLSLVYVRDRGMDIQHIYCFGDNNIALYTGKDLYIFDKNRKITGQITPDIVVKYMCYVPEKDVLMLFSIGEDIYKYSCKTNSIDTSVLMEELDRTQDQYTVHYIENDNMFVFATFTPTGSTMLFADADTLEACAEIEGTYLENSDAPIVCGGIKYAAFYPYYTDKQLLEKARHICGKAENTQEESAGRRISRQF